MARPVTLALLALGAAACADRPSAPPPEAEEVSTAPKDSGLRFEPPVVDLGTVVPSGFVEGRARVRNVSADPVEVVDYSAPCDCTNAAPELPRTLRAGETFDFPLRLDLGNLGLGGLRAEDDDEPEIVERQLSLWTSLGRSAELGIRAEVSEQLEVDPSVVDLGAILRGEPAVATVSVRPGRARPGADVAVLSVRPLGGGPRAVVDRQPAGPGVELSLRFPPPDVVGPFEWELELITDALETPVHLLVRGAVAEPILAVPSAIEALSAPAGVPVQARILVRRRDGLPLELRGVSSTSSRIRVERLAPSSPGSQSVQVVAAVRPWPEETSGEVLIDTDYPGEAGRLRIPVRVRGREPR